MNTTANEVTARPILALIAATASGLLGVFGFTAAPAEIELALAAVMSAVIGVFTVMGLVKALRDKTLTKEEAAQAKADAEKVANDPIGTFTKKK